MTLPHSGQRNWSKSFHFNPRLGHAERQWTRAGRVRTPLVGPSHPHGFSGPPTGHWVIDRPTVCNEDAQSSGGMVSMPPGLSRDQEVCWFFRPIFLSRNKWPTAKTMSWIGLAKPTDRDAGKKLLLIRLLHQPPRHRLQFLRAWHGQARRPAMRRRGPIP